MTTFRSMRSAAGRSSTDLLSARARPMRKYGRGRIRPLESLILIIFWDAAFIMALSVRIRKFLRWILIGWTDWIFRV